MTPRALVLLLPVAVGAALAACQGQATPADCAKIREHYLALVSSAEPEIAKMTPEQQSIAREMSMSLRSGEKAWKKAQGSCEAKVTSKQADCALAATTADAWETCLTK